MRGDEEAASDEDDAELREYRDAHAARVIC